jgi:hypothetical protein
MFHFQVLLLSYVFKIIKSLAVAHEVVAALSPKIPGFLPSLILVHLGFLVDKMALRQVCL